MTTPAPAFYESAAAAADRIDRLRADLRAANEIRKSPRRVRFLDVLDVLGSAIDDSVAQDDENKLAEASADLDRVDDALRWLQGATPEVWSARYTEYVEAVGAMVDGITPPTSDLRLRLLAMPLLAAWRQGGQQPPVPPAVREEYALRLIAVGENMLRHASDPFRRIRKLDALTVDDVPQLAEAAGFPARSQAEAAVINHLRLQALAAAARRAEEVSDPGVVRQIWNVVGWDSFTDFAFDVGLMVVTGGGAAFFRWGKVVVRGTAQLRQVSARARRANRALDQYTDAMVELVRAQNGVRRRLEATRTAGRETLEFSQRLNRQMRHILNQSAELARQVLAAEQLRQELVDAVSKAFAVAGKVGAAEAGNALLANSRAGRIVGYQEGKPTEVAIEEIQEVAVEFGIDARTNLGRRIKDAQDAVVRSLAPPRAGNQGVLYRRWYVLLVARQLAVRIVVLTVAIRGRSPSRPELAKVVAQSMVSAFTDTIAELLPGSSVAKVAGKQIVDTLSDIIENIAAEVAAAVMP